MKKLYHGETLTMANIGLFGNIVLANGEYEPSLFEAMAFFDGIPKTESAFWIRFQTMPLSLMLPIQKKINNNEQWNVFKEILKWHRVTSS